MQEVKITSGRLTPSPDGWKAIAFVVAIWIVSLVGLRLYIGGIA